MDLQENLLSLYSILKNQKLLDALNKFSGSLIYRENTFLENSDASILLGIENKTYNKAKDFDKMSTPNKVMFIKNKFSKLLKDDTHILNYLTPKTTEKDFERTGIQNLEFLHTKLDALTDDSLVDSFLDLWNGYIGEEYNEKFKDLAQDLVRFSFITSGFNMKKNSFAKLIPSEVMVDIGMRDYLNKLKLELQDPKYFKNNHANLLDTFIQNNWYNREVVPKVYNQIDRENGGFITDSPIWIPDVVSGIISIPEKSFKNADNKIKKSPYILVPIYEKITENGNIRNELVDEILYKFYGSDINDTFYYYPVNKKGNRNLNEFTEKSIIEKNNVPYSPEDYITMIETGKDLEGTDLNINKKSFKRVQQLGEEIKPLFTNAVGLISETKNTDKNTSNLIQTFGEFVNTNKYNAGELIMATGTTSTGKNSLSSVRKSIVKDNLFIGEYEQIFEALKEGSTIGVRDVVGKFKHRFLAENVINEVLQHYVDENLLIKETIDGVNYYVKESKNLKTPTEDYSKLTNEESNINDENC